MKWDEDSDPEDIDDDDKAAFEGLRKVLFLSRTVQEPFI
jgi:exportin-T